MTDTGKIYLDNAATTPMDAEVLEAMLPYFGENYGNPSSIHAAGRITKTAVEKARKTIADLLNTSPSEIIFTSGATEADNMALYSGTVGSGVRHLITSPIEHHAVLHTAEHLAATAGVQLHLLGINSQGEADIEELESILAGVAGEGAMVSLMHGNNEIGNYHPIDKIGALCREHNAFFHSDTVQTMGSWSFNMEHRMLHYAVASAHKFHGPKGVGFLYANAENPPVPLIYGGAQERNQRGGTENVAGIVGMAKALELAQARRENTVNHLKSLKAHAVSRFTAGIANVQFNGLSADSEKSLPSVLSVSLPEAEINDMLLFNLDIAGIYVSGGSACTSGANISSHVLDALGHHPARGVIRISFSRFNTIREIDRLADLLIKLFPRER